ncbi:MAG: dolichyl-phosphate beta-glucosyltransferase [Thermoguttaceae bacterium]|jgi:dolichyl-phosphate beta-glucosyltransferase
MVPTGDVILSLVLPAYNEAARLPPYLAAIRPYIEGRYGRRYEVIVVDDGSRDGLAGMLEAAAASWPQLKWIRHDANRGKGAAVRTGMLAARGGLLLFADADGAAPIEEERRLADAIRAGADLAVGSRLVRGPDQRLSRNRIRGLAGRLFAALAGRILRLPIRDPQCGLKMFRAEAGRRLFERCEESRYLFDLELLAMAQRLGYRCDEVSISWHEVPGGHLRLMRELPGVLAGLARVRRRVRSMPIAEESTGSA